MAGIGILRGALNRLCLSPALALLLPVVVGLSIPRRHWHDDHDLRECQWMSSRRGSRPPVPSRRHGGRASPRRLRAERGSRELAKASYFPTDP